MLMSSVVLGFLTRKYQLVVGVLSGDGSEGGDVPNMGDQV